MFLLPIFVWASSAKLGEQSVLMIVVAFGLINLVDALLWRFNDGMIIRRIPADSLVGAVVLTLATLALWGLLCVWPLPIGLVSSKRVVLLFFGLTIAGVVITYSKQRLQPQPQLQPRPLLEPQPQSKPLAEISDDGTTTANDKEIS